MIGPRAWELPSTDLHVSCLPRKYLKWNWHKNKFFSFIIRFNPVSPFVAMRNNQQRNKPVTGKISRTEIHARTLRQRHRFDWSPLKSKTGESEPRKSEMKWRSSNIKTGQKEKTWFIHQELECEQQVAVPFKAWDQSYHYKTGSHDKQALPW